ncbi:MAG: transcriptional regulator [Methylophilales bacterium 28-44-11]|jgi:ArsR family transcriptional regulator|nr:MAG: transcriptional regulator [Methylophilales bacterium 28-44-11]
MTTTINQPQINFDELRASADVACNLMRAMANTDRLMLLCQLSLGEKSVGDLETLLGIHQPTLSQQLTVLREANLVTTRREGKSIIYSISSKAAMAVMHVLHQEICTQYTNP